MLALLMLEEDEVLAAAVRQTVTKFLERSWAPLPPEDLARRCSWVLRLPARERPLKVRNRPEMSRPEIVSALVRLSYELRHADSAESLRIARAAVEAAENLPLPASLTFLLPDFQAQAWCNLANCLRVTEDYDEAAAAWGTAEAHLDCGTGDPLLHADYALKKAEFLRSQQQFDEARRHYLSSARINERCAELQQAAKSRLGLAVNSFYSGNTLEALQEIPRAAKWLDADHEPEIFLALYHNALLFFEDLGHVEAALAVLPTVEPWYEELGSKLSVLRARWLRCRLHLAQGLPRAALRCGEAARKGFLELGQPYDAALCGFDVARAWLEVGEHLRVQKLVQEMHGVFTAKNIPREAAACLAVFADATVRGRLDKLLMHRLAAELKPLRRPGAAPKPSN